MELVLPPSPWRTGHWERARSRCTRRSFVTNIRRLRRECSGKPAYYRCPGRTRSPSSCYPDTPRQVRYRSYRKLVGSVPGKDRQNRCSRNKLLLLIQFSSQFNLLKITQTPYLPTCLIQELRAGILGSVARPHRLPSPELSGHLPLRAMHAPLLHDFVCGRTLRARDFYTVVPTSLQKETPGTSLPKNPG